MPTTPCCATNRSFGEALRTWEEVRKLDPGDGGVAGEIERLRKKEQLARRLKQANRRLSRRIPEIEDIFDPILRRLRELGAEVCEDEVLSHLELAETFLDGELEADELRRTWAKLEAAPAVEPLETPDYPALANRLERGELVLFLSSDVASLFDAGVPDSRGLAAELARRVGYDELGHSIAKVSEFYEVSDDKRSLVRELASLLPARPLEVPLYSMLARVESPLVVVSNAYDLLLERTFLDARKAFAVVSSMVSPGVGYEASSLLIRTSGGDGHEVVPPGQELPPLDPHYSLIYNVRG